ncbi:alpha/beta-hydrolase [Xylariaceae sp. FL0255]|nr:alpha/beta-hydrolase [Xylariaceae sp. FL0255]
MSSILSLTGLLALSGITLSHATPSTPTVTIANGTILGSTSGAVESFLGIPYAQPPTGSLRFRAPVSLNSSFGTFNATGTPPACPQLTQGNVPGFALLPEDILGLYTAHSYAATDVSEDCSTEENPWSGLLSESISLDHPVIIVSINYRVSAFGFLGGSQIQNDHVGGSNTNNGLRDQRLALKWVAENIAAFGGDPDRVTIWGESAGAVSVLYHMLFEGGDNTYKGKPLFHAAIMNSGSSFPAHDVDSDAAQAQAVFDSIAEAGGCNVTGTGAENPLECLRNLPFDELLNATNVVPALFTNTSNALSFIPRPDPTDSFFSQSPEVAVREGKLARVPIMTGNQQDEGALFAISMEDGNTTSRFIDGPLSDLYTTTPRSILSKLVGTYSTNPAAGAPFNSGDTGVIYPEYKRNAAVIGDAFFILQRRYQLEHTVDLMPIWTFSAAYNQTWVPLGTAHGSDLAMFGTGYPVVAYAHISQYYISFVNYLNPNGIGGGKGCKNNASDSLTFWPQWTLGGREMIQFDVDGEKIIKDDFREGSYEYFKTIVSSMRI